MAQHDTTEFRRHTSDFRARLEAAGAVVAWSYLDDRDHFDLIERLSDQHDQLTQGIIAFIGCGPR